MDIYLELGQKKMRKDKGSLSWLKQGITCLAELNEEAAGR